MIKIKKLRDLESLYDATQQNIKVNEMKLMNDIILPSQFKKAFSDEKPGDILFKKYTAVYTATKGLHIYLANQWFYLASLTAEYCSELLHYKKVLYEVFDEFEKNLSSDDKKELIKEAKNKSESDLASMIEGTEFYNLEQNQSEEEIKELLIKFISDENYSHAGKTIDRGDFFYSPILNLANVVAVSSNYIADLSAFFAENPQLNKILLDSFDELTSSVNLQDEYKNALITIDKPHQRIFFGAPGTGKSYQLNIEAEHYFRDNFERVTFHPDYMYGNFVGTFKPYTETLRTKDDGYKTDGDGNFEKRISYEFVPGPFLEQLIQAYAHPEESFLILIEEINRANVAAVFGDIFQLLDRKKDGESEYSIATSKELQDYLLMNESLSNLEEENPEVAEKLGSDFSRLYLPSNFYIWATMNSADQGVMPMDTAFKRRWEFTYLGVNKAANDKKFKEYEFLSSPTEKVKWDDYRRAINDVLIQFNVPEDKLLGPYFISESTLSSDDMEIKTNTIKEKVLMYLYEDVGRPYKTRLFADDAQSTYSSLGEKFDRDARNIFKKPLNIPAYRMVESQTSNSNYYDKSEDEEFGILYNSKALVAEEETDNKFRG
ncbi:AAA family ATPase [Aerococcus urinaeequi]|uniref:AAA family ATPase n=1 Tax=Aerococcus urinaeequi TaxID=51665 RepID=A0AAE9XIQ7_9LACT|nr:AAA family ATPase [Aerococcus urinaeequi]WCG37616.1 AAA family ATPase [Aerococcus urinaeequi]